MINCIKKVLPGVEFSVTILGKVLHIVTLFDDSDEIKIKSISTANIEGNTYYYFVTKNSTLIILVDNFYK